MREHLVHDLACPLCASRLRLDGAPAGRRLETGALVCEGCRRRWPIRNGVPRLVPPDLVPQQRRTAYAFGWQWQHFSELHPEFEAQFLDWIHPLTPEDFRGKRVLDAGCGIGRHAYFAASYGAREVVAVDLSDAVESARRNLAPFENVDVVQGDLLRLPFRTAAEGGGFDLIYCIGVLHHLPDPAAGVRSLVRYLRPHGKLAVWVYGYENNGFVRRVVEPLRRVTTRIPPPLLRVVAWPLAVAFHAVSKGVYRPLQGRRAAAVLPLSEYLTSVSHFSFLQNYGIVFDQLAAPTAVYVKEHELRQWLEECGLDEVQLTHRHGNSWRALGRAPAAVA